MADRIKAIRDRLLEFWNNYSAKQKSLVISVLVGVLLTILLLSYVLTRTQYKKLITCETAKQTNEVVTLLEEQQIEYKLSNNSTVVSVDEKKYDAARLLLGSNNILDNDGMTYEQLFDNSLSTTESERKLKSNIYMQDKLANTIKSFDGIRDAVVYLTTSDQDVSILNKEVKHSASVVLTTTDEFPQTAAASIAEMVASAIDTDVENVRVTGSNGVVLYDGTSDLYSSGNLASVEDYKKKLTNTRANDIRILLIKQGYDDAEVIPHFEFDMDVVEELYTEYTPAAGSDQGVYKSSYEYKAENTDGASGIPGTDTNNDDVTYEIQDNNVAASNVKYSDIEYLPNVRVTNTQKEIGAINTNDSSVSIVLTKYKVYSEETLEEKGELKGTNFEEYIEDNNLEKVDSLTVDDSLIASVSAATGIAANKINITAYQQPIFKFKEETKRGLSDYLLLILLVAIIAMLVFVVIKGTAPIKVEELEPELSVEEMLATSVEVNNLDDIAYNEKSDARRVIENFVDENPEAAARLLRNWLKDEWGM